MADEPKASPEEGLEEEENNKEAVSKDEAKQAAALERMSGGQENASNVDASKARNAIGLLTTQSQLTGISLSAIKIDAANVKLLVEELEISKEEATQLLKKGRGSVEEALSCYFRVKI